MLNVLFFIKTGGTKEIYRSIGRDGTIWSLWAAIAAVMFVFGKRAKNVRLRGVFFGDRQSNNTLRTRTHARDCARPPVAVFVNHASHDAKTRRVAKTTQRTPNVPDGRRRRPCVRGISGVLFGEPDTHWHKRSNHTATANVRRFCVVL